MIISGEKTQIFLAEEFHMIHGDAPSGGDIESSPPLEHGLDSVTSFQRTEDGWEKENWTEETLAHIPYQVIR